MDTNYNYSNMTKIRESFGTKVKNLINSFSIIYKGEGKHGG